MVNEVGEECSNGTAVHQRHPPQEHHHHRMDVLELVTVGEHLAHQLQLVVEEYLALSPLPPLPQVHWRRPAKVLQSGLGSPVVLPASHSLQMRLEPILHEVLPGIFGDLLAGFFAELSSSGVFLLLKDSQQVGVLVFHLATKVDGVHAQGIGRQFGGDGAVLLQSTSNGLVDLFVADLGAVGDRGMQVVGLGGTSLDEE